MKITKLWAGLLLIFVSGILIGAFGAGIFVKHRVRQFIVSDPDRRGAMILNRYSYELQLSENQRTDIKRILSQTENEISEIRAKTHPEIETIVNRRAEMMKKVLSVEQQKKLDHIHEQMKKRTQRYWRKGRGRGRGPGPFGPGPGKNSGGKGFPKGGPGLRGAAFLERCSAELELDENQQQEVQQILHQSEQQLSEIHQKNRQQVDTIILDSIAMMKKILTVDQQKKLDHIHKEMKKRRNHTR